MSDVTAEAQILIRRPASEVFEAFVNPDIMTKFWFPKATGRLETGKEVKWYVGTDADAFGIAVRVKVAQKPYTLHIQWGEDDASTDVEWKFEAQGDSRTIVRICESGFSGEQSDVVLAALNSTGGFNQMITAAKALLEHGARINVVEDHVS